MNYLLHRSKHRAASRMRKQRNTSQIKGQKKPPEMELNEVEATNLLETEFKTLIIRMMQELSENFNKEIASIKDTDPDGKELYQITEELQPSRTGKSQFAAVT